MKKEIGRREFLKIALGTAAAAGLSHFRFLNIGGPAPASAGDQCGLLQAPDGWCVETDACASTDPDGRDTCWPEGGDPDVCGAAEADVCMPTADTDQCTVVGDPDYGCEARASDTCSAQDPDLCWPEHDPDACTPPADEDICAEPEEPDACTAVGDPDYDCATADTCSAADPDLCSVDRDPDECSAPGDTDYACPYIVADACTPPGDPDACSPPYDPDEPVRQPPPEEFVPEPGSMALLASGLLGLAGYTASRWRNKEEAEE